MKNQKGSAVLVLLGFILCLSFVGWSGLRVYKSIIFNIEVGGHLKRAADANTIELAKEEMEIVVSYLEKSGMKSGYTSVLYNTPNEDVGFWYKNLKSALEELKKITPEFTQLEKSNVLIKLRETLLDSGEKGLHVTMPPGISISPNNSGYAFFGWISALLGVVGIIVIIFGLDL